MSYVSDFILISCLSASDSILFVNPSPRGHVRGVAMSIIFLFLGAARATDANLKAIFF